MSRLRELYAEKAAPAWSWLVETLNDPTFFATHLSAHPWQARHQPLTGATGQLKFD